MNYTQFHGNTFLFINKDASEFPLVTNQDVDLTMYYQKLLLESNKTHKTFECTFFNKDESEAELCGNALFGLMKQEGFGEYMFKTKAGRFGAINTGKELRLGMKKADIDLDCDEQHFAMYKVNVGNCHVVCYEKEIYSKYLKAVMYDARHTDYSEEIKKLKFNLHSVIQKDTNTFEVRCFERGVGETQACGSGAYAVGVAMMKHFNLDEVKIVMKGGEYTVKKDWLIVKI